MEGILLYLLIGAGVLALGSKAEAQSIEPSVPVTPVMPTLPLPTGVMTAVLAAPTNLQRNGNTFSWGSVAGAQQYHLTVHKIGTLYAPCSSLSFCGVVNGLSQNVILEQGASYDWWVSALNGETESASTGASFSVPVLTPIVIVPSPPVIVSPIPNPPTIPYVPPLVLGGVVTYPAVVGTGLRLSPDYQVTVNGRSVPVYQGEGILEYSFASFDTTGGVTVKVISLTQGAGGTVIRKVGGFISPSVSGNEVTFTVPISPMMLSVEPNGRNNPLFIFASTVEVNRPSNATYFYGSGYHEIGAVTVRSGETMYIGGGAAVHGKVVLTGTGRLIGRGILQGKGRYRASRTQATDGSVLSMSGGNGVVVEGIVIKDSDSWTVGMNNSDGTRMSQTKIVSVMGPVWHDGIHNTNSRNTIIEDGFILSDDDCFGIRGAMAGDSPVENYIARRMMVWAPATSTWRIAWMGQTPYMRNLAWEDIEVIHSEFIDLMGFGDDALLKIEAEGYGASQVTPVFGLRFERIRVNVDAGWGGDFIRVGIGSGDQLAQAHVNGRVDGVVFKDITLLGTKPSNTMGNIVVCGESEPHHVKNVSFENVMRFGQSLVANKQNYAVCGGATYNIIVR